MPNLTFSTGDFVPFSKIKSADVNSKFDSIATLLNVTGLDDTNIQDGGITRSTKLSAGNAHKLLVNDASGNMSELVDGVSGQVLQSAGVGNALTWTSAVQLGPRTLGNLALTASVAANALTVTLRSADNTDFSSSNTGQISFRDETATDGSIDTATLSSNISLTVPSGATLGHRDGEEWPIYVYAAIDAGAVSLAVSSTLLDERELQTAVALSASADNVYTLYNAAGFGSGKPIRLIGRLLSTQATAGTWATAPSLVYTGNFDLQTQVNRIIAYSGNGHGSSNTKVRRFSTFNTVGSAITATDTAGGGTLFTINQSGWYLINYSDSYSLGDAQLGITKNSAELTTNIGSVTEFLKVLGVTNTAGAGFNGQVSGADYLEQGDTVRAHTNGLPDSTDSVFSRFIITKVG